jgi:hypothetical protein
MSVVHICANQGYANGLLERFYPRTIEMLRLPAGVPEGIKKEFEEAEICASVEAWRAAFALLRAPPGEDARGERI